MSSQIRCLIADAVQLWLWAFELQPVSWHPCTPSHALTQPAVARLQLSLLHEASHLWPQ